ncbi:polyadenylation and cleavage factor-like [Heracleum sosnowskyi]|uniref:Polyadenylation and cleavage factor-like n=1 Tax=Heracleum sosnowskyi TaxID=360622 RepID=A0AAD8I4L7_9APIA|nr:polyadenylation and cleavage factor-like [Heracleum sosnowskyi]
MPTFNQKPMTPIINKFKLMLKNRQDKFKADDYLNVVPAPTSDEIVMFYDVVLSELTINSKPIITDLTIIADDMREFGQGIADVICARILEVSADQKMPSFYLLDSIVKNVGKEYVRYFASRLPEVFCEAYKQLDPSLRPSMHRLFGTWSSVFPASILGRIEDELQLSSARSSRSSGLTPLRTSESSRPTHGIHVNPKYLEARRQLGHLTADINIQHPKGESSSNLHGNQSVGHGTCDFNDAEIIPRPGVRRLNSTDRAAQISFASDADKLVPSTAAKMMKSTLRSTADNKNDFSRRIVERDSPSHPGFDYGLGRVTGREEASNLQRSHRSVDTHLRYDVPDAYSYSTDNELEGPRALIDAYGKDQGQQNISCKPTEAGYTNTSGISNNLTGSLWQNSEEEEFDWEDMSPALSNGRMNTDLIPSSTVMLESSTARSGFETPASMPVENDFRRDNFSGRAQHPVRSGSSIVEDALSSTGLGHGFINNISGIREEETQFRGSQQNPPKSKNFLHNLSQSSQNVFNASVGGRNIQVPLLVSAGEQKTPFLNSFPGGNMRGPLGSMPGVNSSSFEPASTSVQASNGVWPPGNMHKSYPLPGVASPLHVQQVRNHFDLMNTGTTNVHQAQNSVLHPPSLVRHDVQQKFVLPAAISSTSHIGPPHINHGYIPRGYGPPVNSVGSNSIRNLHQAPQVLNNPSMTMHLPRGALPPLPLGARPPWSQMIPVPQNPNFLSPNPRAGVAFSGLFSSLMAQGLISLKNQPPVQDHVGLEFSSDLQKVRYESAITSLYADLPRQCTTCGIRFKSQEEHSSHMDWHVTKNRMSKNSKQKPSRKWFVCVDMWLSGAEALGADAGPGFLLTENISEQKNDEELAVPADEDQNICALCGEAFDDFYSDETEEWMYRGAVYMNAPAGSSSGIERSQLGPIVHAKCRPESNIVPSEDFSTSEKGYAGEDVRRKRMRIS